MKRQHIVRPHIAELLRLLPHFRLGVFSSATTRTVRTALQTLGNALRHEAAQRGIGECACVRACIHSSLALFGSSFVAAWSC